MESLVTARVAQPVQPGARSAGARAKQIVLR